MMAPVLLCEPSSCTSSTMAVASGKTSPPSACCADKIVGCVHTQQRISVALRVRA